MSDKSNELQRKLETAQGELAAAQLRRDSVLAEENAATVTSVAFNRWRSERDTAIVETERLTRLVGSIETAIDDQRNTEAAEAYRKQVAAAKKRNAALARQMIDDGADITTRIRNLLREVALAEIETQAVNALRTSADDEIVVSAEFLARGRPAVPRKDLGCGEHLMLWVFKSTGNLIGDQDGVIQIGPGVGFLPIPGSSMPHQPCVQRKYVSRRYLPAEPAEYPDPLASQLKLPDFSGGGLSWDGSRIVPTPLAVLAELERVPIQGTKRSRSEQMELEPAEPLPAEEKSEMQQTLHGFIANERPRVRNPPYARALA